MAIPRSCRKCALMCLMCLNAVLTRGLFTVRHQVAKRKRGLHNHLPHLSFARGVAERRNQNYGTAANPGYHPSPLGRTSNRFSVKLELQSASSPFGAGHAVGWFWVIVVIPLGFGNSPILVMRASILPSAAYSIRLYTLRCQGLWPKNAG